MRQFYLLGFVAVVAALPAADGSLYCTSDALYKSLALDGRQFCSVLLDQKSRCREVSTPTQYATHDGSRLSHYVSAK